MPDVSYIPTPLPQEQAAAFSFKDHAKEVFNIMRT